MPAAARSTRLALGVLAVSAVGVLTACGAQGGAGSTGSPDLTAEPTTPASNLSTPSASATESAASGAYADGDYTATGEYQTPGGPESLEVTLTVAGDAVTAVEIVGSGKTPNAERYQEQFASGIDAAAVGKPLETLEVGAISGASLAPKGFNAAVEQIRSDAAA